MLQQIHSACVKSSKAMKQKQVGTISTWGNRASTQQPNKTRGRDKSLFTFYLTSSSFVGSSFFCEVCTTARDMKSALLIILLFSTYMFISTAQGKLCNRSDLFATQLFCLFASFFPWISYVRLNLKVCMKRGFLKHR